MAQRNINGEQYETLLAGLKIPTHDYVALSYTGSNLTGVVYRDGGSSGTIVGTLTLTYSGSDLTSIART